MSPHDGAVPPCSPTVLGTLGADRQLCWGDRWHQALDRWYRPQTGVAGRRGRVTLAEPGWSLGTCFAGSGRAVVAWEDTAHPRGGIGPKRGAPAEGGDTGRGGTGWG